MIVLALDIGSSSIKAAVLKRGKIHGHMARRVFATSYDGVRAEVRADDLLGALAKAIGDLGPAVRGVDVIALAHMAPSWCAMDHAGKAITPIVTHQDRRSVAVAQDLERRVGKARFLKLAGNRPFPGGISCTTWAWFVREERPLMKKADLCGHVNTLLHRTLTHSRVTDPSNASFSGLYKTLTQEGWDDQLIDAAGVSRHCLPQVVGAEEIAGLITRPAARRFGLTHGTPMLTGCMDGSAAVLLAGNEPGRLINACGSTDVLALVTDRPVPHERLLTRAVGVGRRWVSVSTLAAAGSAIDWAHRTLFSELSPRQFHALCTKLAGEGPATSGLVFENALAGDRMSIVQATAAVRGLSLATTRQAILHALLESLARDSAARLNLLRSANQSIKISQRVLVTGGAGRSLANLLHRDWPGKWTFTAVDEATLKGLGRLPAE